VCSSDLVLSSRSIDDRAATVRDSTSRDVRSVLGALSLVDPGAATSVEPTLLLASHLRKAERSRDTGAASVLPVSVAPAYIDLLAGWPGEIPTAVESVQIAGASMTISGSLADSADWENLRGALGDGLVAWAEKSASMNRSRDFYRFSLVYERSSEGDAP